MNRITLTTQKLRRFAHCEEGGVLAELAIIVPFLAIMLAGVSEFGRYFQTYTTLSKSTRTAARYLSNHPYTDPTNGTVARNLVVCGKTVCAGGDELVSGITTANVCIQYTPAAPPETVTVSIPRTAGGCGAPHTYQPIFDLGALLNNNQFTLSLPISPSNTMYYMLNN
jgi:hypothetical protein